MIELRLTVTIEQMRRIADVLEQPVADKPKAETATIPENIEWVGGQVEATEVIQATVENGELTVESKLFPADDQPVHEEQLNIGENDELINTDHDAEGLPWDKRINAGTKTKKADGTWKRLKGVSDELVTEVKAELRAALAAVPPVEGDTDPKLVQPAGTATDQAGSTANPTSAPVAASQASSVPAPPAAADVPPPPAVERPTTFPGLLPLVTAAKANGTKSDADIQAAIEAVGLTQFGELAVRPDLIGQFADRLGV